MSKRNRSNTHTQAAAVFSISEVLMVVGSPADGELNLWIFVRQRAEGKAQNKNLTYSLNKKTKIQEMFFPVPQAKAEEDSYIQSNTSCHFSQTML